QLGKAVLIEPADHLHIDARGDGRRRRSRFIRSDAVYQQLANAFVVADYKPVELPFHSKHLIEREAICSRRNPVEIVERTHESSGARIERRFERWEVDLTKRSFRDFSRVVVATALGRAVRNPVLCASKDLVFLTERAPLKAANLRRGERRDQIWILAPALGNATPARISSYVQHRSKSPAHPCRVRLKGRDAGR